MPNAADHPDSVDGPKGRNLWQRADQVLPGGSVYITRSADFAGRGVLPGFITEASGCRVVDADGRSYIDFLGANGPNLLGYGHPEVAAAVQQQMALASSASMFPPALVELVESLLGHHPDMAWGMLAKNGSDVVSLAVRTARQHSQRPNLVAFTAAYHGSDDELASRPPSGPLRQNTSQVLRLPWNDAPALTALMDRQGDHVAAILLNPLDQNPRQATREASPAFIAAINAAQARHHSCLILDDVRHGFRLHPRGSQHLLGVTPDLVCLGKALGNGHGVAALLGRADLRQAASRILYTSTYVFEAPPMRAALAVLRIYHRDQVHGQLVRAGERLCQGLLKAATAAGEDISITGPATMPTLLFNNDPEFLRQRRFAQQAAALGAIFHPALNWNLSLAHSDADIDEAIAIAARAFAGTGVAGRAGTD